MMNTKRLVVIASSVVGALLVVAIVVGVVLLNTMNAQAEDARYRDCMASQGFGPGSPADVTTDDQVEAYFEDAIDAANFCSR